MFRSLARRSQSLLHRQLTLLDQMERRASDPEALDDLFRLDHLTTRMRRHAEGLVILAGAPPGRGWSTPVRMVDVMRGAIAEVEDYARVSVATSEPGGADRFGRRGRHPPAGRAHRERHHAVAAVYAGARVRRHRWPTGSRSRSRTAGSAWARRRLAELNGRLASPPEFNLFDSEQLGLFVVSQLAKRHGIRVTLEASPYGGTAAIVLIPRHLVVTEEAFRSGLPGEPAMAQLTANGDYAVPRPPGRPRYPGRAGRTGFRLRVQRARRHTRARPGAGGTHLRAAARLAGDHPGSAGTRRTHRTRARHGERHGGQRVG